MTVFDDRRNSLSDLRTRAYQPPAMRYKLNPDGSRGKFLGVKKDKTPTPAEYSFMYMTR